MSLTGKTVLNCRPEEDRSELSRLISAHHGHVVECPALRRVPLLNGEHGEEFLQLLERLGSQTVAAFTSPHSVRLTAEFLQAENASELLAPMTIAVVGKGTEAEGRKHGLSPAIVAADAHGEGLARAIIEWQQHKDEDPAPYPPIILIRNEAAEKGPVHLLSSAGFVVHEFAPYRGEGVEPSRFFESVIRFVEKGGRFDFVVMSSAEGVRHYSKLLSRFSQKSPKATDHLRHTPVVAFAPKTAVVIREMGLQLAGTAAEPNDGEVVRALERAVLAHRLV